MGSAGSTKIPAYENSIGSEIRAKLLSKIIVYGSKVLAGSGSVSVDWVLQICLFFTPKFTGLYQTPSMS